MRARVLADHQQNWAQIPQKITIIYLLVAGSWILLSDRLLALVVTNPEMHSLLQTVKGWFFVLITALLLYWLIRRHVQAVSRVERKHQSNLRFLETLLDTIPNPVFYKDASGVYQGCNTAFATQILGLPKEKIVGASLFDLRGVIPADLAEIYHQQDTALLQNPGAQIYETQVRTANDGRRDFMFNKAVYFDSSGQSAGIVGVMVDIFERKRTEQEIQRHNRELTLLNQVIAASVTESDQQTMLTAACRALGQAYSASVVCVVLLDFAVDTATVAAEYQRPDSGYPSILHQTVPARNEAVAQYFREFGKPLVLDNAQQDSRTTPFRHLLTQLDVDRLVIVPLTVNDQFIGMLNVGNPLDANPSGAGITLIARVADQLAGTLTRWQSDARQRLLSTAIEQTSESILITNADATILYVNPAFEQTTGYTREEVIGKTPRILNSHRQDTAFYADMWATINAGRVWHGRLVNRKKDGSLYTDDITISPVTDKHNKIVNFVSVQRDVSRELQLEEQYYQSQKMESIGRLAGGVAHDFNNLLTGIMGFSELALQSLEPGTPARNDIQGVLKNAASAANLTRQLLAFARRQAVDPKILNLNEIVRNLNKMLRRLIGEHIVFETNLADDLGQVKADSGQIEQVMLNLAVNARDAMPNGGRLLVETANVSLTAKMAGQFAEFEPGDYILVAVSDTGAGMTEEVKARIFEPFFTTKEVGQGTGLGLATVFGIIKQAHGHILVTSQPGTGTTFKIYLPRVFAPPETTSAETSQPRSWPRGTETILLVEDEESVRELSAYALRDRGYTVLVAANGKEAMPMARQHTGQIDLLLTDMVMPYMSGITLAEKLKLAYPMLKILFTSGYADRVTFYQDMLDPDAAFLSKPFLPATLVQQVRAILDSDG